MSQSLFKNISHKLKSLNFLSFLLLACSAGYTQNNQSYDSLKAKCEGPVFTICEEMPDLKYGIKSFGDSLKIYLLKRNAFPIYGVAKFQLTILRSGQIENAVLIMTDIEDKKITGIIEEAINSLSNHWTPGRQNGYLVCVYRKLVLYFTDNRIEITLPKL